jgi:hypothetical protein
MALDFSAAGSRVDVGSGSSIDNLTVFTVLQWVLPTAFTVNKRFWNKGTGSGTQHGVTISTGDTVAYSRGRAGASCNIISSTAMTVDVWNCIAITVDFGASPVGKIYFGLLNTPLTEVSYGTTDDGSGTVFNDSANNLYIGNRNTGADVFPGHIATTVFWNRILTLAEMRQAQLRQRIISSLAGYWELGFQGVGTQQDYSGNGNSGTVTNAILSAHPPIINPFAWHLEDDAYVIAAALTGKPWLYYANQYGR